MEERAGYFAYFVFLVSPVVWLFLGVQLVCRQFVIMVLSDRTHYFCLSVLVSVLTCVLSVHVCIVFCVDKCICMHVCFNSCVFVYTCECIYTYFCRLFKFKCVC